ncbi:hypothetical protein TCRASSO_50329 [Tenacibaculum crassostreae]
MKEEIITVNCSSFDNFILKIQKKPNITFTKTSKDSFIIESKNSFKYFFFDFNPSHINSIKINGRIINESQSRLEINLKVKTNSEFLILMSLYTLISFFVYLNYQKISFILLLIIPLVLFFCYNSYKTSEHILYNNVKSLLKE